MIFAYFRKQRIRRIKTMLRPPTIRDNLGCAYGSVKLFTGTVTPIIVAAPFLQVLIAFDKVLPDIIKLLLMAAAGVCALAAAIMILDKLDAKWRGKDEAPLPELTPTIGEYTKFLEKRVKDSPARAGTIAMAQHIPVAAAKGLETLTGEQLTILEDAVLLVPEYNGYVQRYAYGLHFMIIFGYASFFIGVGAAYALLEPYWRDLTGNAGGAAPLIFAGAVALYTAWRVMRDSKGLWLGFGMTGRNLIRRALYYWPITFFFLTACIATLKST